MNKQHPKPVCKHCNSDNIVFDALAAWDELKQAWMLLDVQDNAECSDCDGQTSIKWVSA